MAELEESTDVSIPFEYNAPKDKRHFTDEVSFQKFCRILDQFLKFQSCFPWKDGNTLFKSSKKCL